MDGNLRTRILHAVVVMAALCCSPAGAQTGPAHVTGHISNVTFNGNEVLIIVDAGLPGNCTGASSWMRIPPEFKPINAFVLGLWMRGDAAQVTVTVYAAEAVGGYCVITQIDPAG
jgi:hypothetical protein